MNTQRIDEYWCFLHVHLLRFDCFVAKRPNPGMNFCFRNVIRKFDVWMKIIQVSLKNGNTSFVSALNF